MGMEGESLHQVAIDMTDPGRAKITLDGEEIASKVEALHFSGSASDRQPTVVLELVAGTGVSFDGVARVEIGERPDPGPAAGRFLAAIDPGELERRALANTGFDGEPHATTRAILDQLRRWASGDD